MNPGKLIKFVLLVVIAGSCLTPVDIELENQAGGITVYGQVSNYGRRNYVEVGLTAGTSRKPVGISSATVFLNDSDGNKFQYQKSTVAGRYLLPNFIGIPGRSYWIEVTLSSGEVITSEPDTMPIDVGEDEITWDFSDDLLTDTDGQVNELHWLNIRAKPTLPAGKKLFLRWSVDEIYVIFPTDFPDPFGTIPPSCYVTNVTDGQRMTLYSTEEQFEVTEPLLIAKRQFDKTFHIRINFLNYQSSLSEKAYDYWSKAYVLSNQVGSIFDTPPAQLYGNLHFTSGNGGVVHGYFNALHEEYNKFFITKTDVPYPYLPYCDYAPERNDYTRECLNCLIVPNSSYTEPPEWNQ